MTSSTLKIKLPQELLEALHGIGEHLRHSSRFSLPPRLERYVDNFVSFYSDNSTVELPKSETYYRARLHGIGQSDPYTRKMMGAPPKGLASSGRINPDGISYLYVASEVETAISEVRPWKGAEVSVAQLNLKQRCKVVELSNSTSGQPSPNGMEWLGNKIISQLLISLHFAAPAHSQDRLAYLPSQFIAEKFKDKGFQGMKYPSVLHPSGFNVALFDPMVAKCRSVEVFSVKSVKYEFEAASATLMRRATGMDHDIKLTPTEAPTR